MNQKELMELVNKRYKDIDPWYRQHDRKCAETHNLLFWFTVIGAIVCAILLCISYLIGAI